MTIERLDVAAYRVPTPAPESDGTATWDHTTLVLVEVEAGGERGLGYSYADTATAELVRATLAEVVCQQDALNTAARHAEMAVAVRNLGRPGIASMAISAVDTALWDLKAKVLSLPLARLLGQARAAVPIYGSGGFTSEALPQLQAQLAGWVEEGIPRVKMKIGRTPDCDLARVRAAREAIGPGPRDRASTESTSVSQGVELFVDANGAYQGQQALKFAEAFAELGVSWFEEPVTSDDLPGLRWLRGRMPAGVRVAAGEYGYDLTYFQRMLAAEAVDVQQADVTRCGGYTGFLKVGALCEAHHLRLSAHCAPALSLPACCAVPALAPAEYFADHVRVEQLLFDGVPRPLEGELRPDLSRPGHGLELKRADAERYRV